MLAYIVPIPIIRDARVIPYLSPYLSLEVRQPKSTSDIFHVTVTDTTNFVCQKSNITAKSVLQKPFTNFKYTYKYGLHGHLNALYR